MKNQDTQNLEPSSADATSGSTSQLYVGRWNRLVSTTNWEKGRIIRQWREALIASGATAADYADDVWASHVGNVSGQHVGRLRRVDLRFGEVHADFDSLFWSHFHAALDWNDAEMWLEGALQNGWSVSQMRAARWEALGAPDELRPNEEDIVAAEIDEDVDTTTETGSIDAVNPIDGGTDVVRDPSDSGAPADDDWDENAAEVQGAVASHSGELDADDQPLPRSRPFENLADLPDDLADAFEAFKLAILHHKLAGWKDVPRDDVLASLDALKQLALAPPDE